MNSLSAKSNNEKRKKNYQRFYEWFDPYFPLNSPVQHDGQEVS